MCFVFCLKFEKITMAFHRYFLFISHYLHPLFFYFLYLLELLQFRLKFPIF